MFRGPMSFMDRIRYFFSQATVSRTLSRPSGGRSCATPPGPLPTTVDDDVVGALATMGSVLADLGHELFGDQLGATGAEEALDLSLALGLEWAGMDQGDTESGADHGKLVGTVIGTVVNE